MSGVKISALPAASAANDSDQLEVNQSGTSRRVTVGQIAVELTSALTPAISIERYGAFTSASGAVNSAAIEAALAANRTIYIPEGVYNVAEQYAGVTTGSTRGICIRVPANKTILGPGTLQYTTPPRVVGAPAHLTAIVSIIGSNVRIQGVTFNDAHVPVLGEDTGYYSTCRASGIVAGDGEDPIVTYNIENIIVNDCTFTNNFYPVFFRVKALSSTTISDFKIMHCRGIANPLSAFSGGFTCFGMNPWLDTNVAPIRNGTQAFNLMRGAKTSAGMEYAGTSGGTFIGNVCEDCWFAGFETEGGDEEFTFVGNRAIRCGDPFWFHDSKRVVAVGNIANVTPTTPELGGANIQHGIQISKGGFDGVTGYVVDEIVVANNIVKDGNIIAGNYGAGTGTFGSLTIIGNDVQQRPASISTALSMGSAASKTIIGNTLKGGTTTTMNFSAAVAEPMIVIGNVTTANSAEASVGIAVSGTPNFAYGFNDFVNGVGAVSTAYARFGNRDATTTQMQAQSGHIINFGTGSPEATVTGTSGDIYQRIELTTANPVTLQVKTGTGTTGWSPAQVISSGTTAARPAISSVSAVGFRYFDTTLGKPVWWNGTVWKDATGTTV